MSLCRALGGLEQQWSRAYEQHAGCEAIALTIHTREPLDLGLAALSPLPSPLTNGVTAGLVQVCVQELQHQCPLLTSRIQEGAFTPMEVPTLPIHTPGDTTHTGEHEQWWHGY